MISKAAKVIILSVLSSVAAWAQNYHLGVNLSPTFNWISTTQPSSDSELNVKFSGGLIAEFDLTDRYSVASGIDIVNRGGRINIQDTLGDYTSGFIQIPIALKMRTREFGYMTYFAKFGGSIGFEYSERTTIDPDLAADQRQDSYVNFFSALFVAGVGFEYSLGGSDRIVVGVDYNRSLLDNLVDDDPRLDNSYYYRFDYVTLFLGYIF